MIDDLAEVMAGVGDYARLGVRLFQVMLGFNQFRCDLIDGTISDPEAIIARAISLDEPLAAVCENYPSEWRFETIYVQGVNPDIVFNGCYHVYGGCLGGGRLQLCSYVSHSSPSRNPRCPSQGLLGEPTYIHTTGALLAISAVDRYLLRDASWYTCQRSASPWLRQEHWIVR